MATAPNRAGITCTLCATSTTATTSGMCAPVLATRQIFGCLQAPPSCNVKVKKRCWLLANTCNDRTRHAETHRIVQYWESRADLLESARNILAGVGKGNKVFAPYKRAALAELQEMIDEIQTQEE